MAHAGERSCRVRERSGEADLREAIELASREALAKELTRRRLCVAEADQIPTTKIVYTIVGGKVQRA